MTDKRLKLTAQERMIILAMNYNEDTTNLIGPMELSALIDAKEELARIKPHLTATELVASMNYESNLGREVEALKLKLARLQLHCDEGSGIMRELIDKLKSVKNSANDIVTFNERFFAHVPDSLALVIKTYREATKDLI